MAMTETVQLRRVGYFALDGKGNPRSGYERPYEYRLLEDPGVSLDDKIHFFRVERPLKSFVVEMLASIRESRAPSEMFGPPEAFGWIESRGLALPVAVVQDDPITVRILHDLTPEGRDFLRIHEAPEAWL